MVYGRCFRCSILCKPLAPHPPNQHSPSRERTHISQPNGNGVVCGRCDVGGVWSTIKIERVAGNV